MSIPNSQVFQCICILFRMKVDQGYQEITASVSYFYVTTKIQKLCICAPQVLDPAQHVLCSDLGGKRVLFLGLLVVDLQKFMQNKKAEKDVKPKTKSNTQQLQTYISINFHLSTFLIYVSSLHHKPIKLRLEINNCRLDVVTQKMPV